MRPYRVPATQSSVLNIVGEVTPPLRLLFLLTTETAQWYAMVGKALNDARHRNLLIVLADGEHARLSLPTILHELSSGTA